jgi:hypothetical protein
MLYRKPDDSESVASPVRSIGPLTAPFAQPPMAYIKTTVPSIYGLSRPSSFTPSQTPSNRQIRQAVEDPLASNALLVPFNQINCEISLTECIGHGAVGQVFIGTTDIEKYTVKIVP